MSDAVWRDVHRGRVWRAQACRIVEESPDSIALWMPRGTLAMLPMDETAAHPDPRRRAGSSSRTGWTRESVVSRAARSGALDLRLLAATGEFAHWYVNFEEPLRRTPVGFDTFDQKLDLIVMPDGTFRWKDEDELEQAAALGLVDADAVRAEAARVLEEWPFPTGWEDWRPDPAWPIPQLPEGWDRV